MAADTPSFEDLLSAEGAGEMSAAEADRVDNTDPARQQFKLGSVFRFLLNTAAYLFNLLAFSRARFEITHDASAETTGTDVTIQRNLVTGIGFRFETVAAGAANALLTDGGTLQADALLFAHVASTTGPAVYTASGELWANLTPFGAADVFVPTVNGRAVRVRHSDNPSGISGASTLHFDDDGGSTDERLVSVMAGAANGTFLTDRDAAFGWRANRRYVNTFTA